MSDDAKNNPSAPNEQLMASLRIMMISVGVSLATKFGIDGSVVPAIVGGLFALATAGWSLYTRRKQGLINSAANAAPEVKMVAPDAIASAGPANVIPASTNKVVSQ